eukprot:6491778-Amphidinium_carterae.2
MRSLSLLLAEGATVLREGSKLQNTKSSWMAEGRVEGSVSLLLAESLNNYGVRWVDRDKSPDLETPDLRSRLVVQETRGNSSIAAGDVMCGTSAGDLKHCKLKRKVFIRLPEEDPSSEVEGVCGLLVTALNGVRDAAQSFEHTIHETLTQNGLKQGAFSPCVYHSKEHRVGVMHHGDDFVAVGPRRATPKVGEALSTVFIVKDRGVLGPRAGDLKQIRVFNRTLVWKHFPTAIEYTAYRAG